MFGYGPCKKVRASGIRGLLGIASPSKILIECPNCDDTCPWWDRMCKTNDKMDARQLRIWPAYAKGVVEGFENG